MAAIQSLRALPLNELIGSALSAVVGAEAQAARATLDFVEGIGFEPKTDPQAPSKLRMAAFSYTKRDENGQPAEFTAEVPLLSLLPVPSVQVADARIAFQATIVDLTTAPAPPSKTPPRPGDVLATRRVDLLARPAPVAGPREQEVRGTFHIEVEVTMKQADIPLGLEKIFNLMDQAIDDAPAPSRDTREG